VCARSPVPDVTGPPSCARRGELVRRRVRYGPISSHWPSVTRPAACACQASRVRQASCERARCRVPTQNRRTHTRRTRRRRTRRRRTQRRRTRRRRTRRRRRTPYLPRSAPNPPPRPPPPPPPPLSPCGVSAGAPCPSLPALKRRSAARHQAQSPRHFPPCTSAPFPPFRPAERQRRNIDGIAAVAHRHCRTRSGGAANTAEPPWCSPPFGTLPHTQRRRSAHTCCRTRHPAAATHSRPPATAARLSKRGVAADAVTNAARACP
jgi:hypothetical protein